MNDNLKIVLINFVVSFMIAVYGTYRCKTTSYQDPYTFCLVGKGPLCNFLDGWGVMHFIYFMLLGYSFPHNLPTVFWMGVLWEAIESYSRDHPFYLSECKYSIGTDKQSGWWYGRWEDVVMNTLGMLCGYFLYTQRQAAIDKLFKKTMKRK